jgi:hypothetical protein
MAGGERSSKGVGRGLSVVLLGAATFAGIVALQLDDHSGTSRPRTAPSTTNPAERTTTTSTR